MTLFNYDNCPCKNNKCKSVVALANILPVDVCNPIGGYIKPTCFDCWYLRDEEEHFMRNKDIPEEGLEKAELQLQVIKLMQNNVFTLLAENQYSIKQDITENTLTEYLIYKKLKNGLKIEKCIIKL